MVRAHVSRNCFFRTLREDNYFLIFYKVVTIGNSVKWEDTRSRKKMGTLRRVQLMYHPPPKIALFVKTDLVKPIRMIHLEPFVR